MASIRQSDYDLFKTLEEQDEASHLEILRSDMATSLLPTECVSNFVPHLQSACSKLLSESKEKEELSASLLKIGIAALQIFNQNNYTGPPVAVWENEAAQKAKKSILLALAFDEPLYSHTQTPELLALAKIILHEVNEELQCSALVKKWWEFRFLRTYQTCFPSLIGNLYKDTNKVSSSLLPLVENSEIESQLLLERALFHIYFYEVGRAKELLERVQTLADLKISLTGKLGKRTYHQKKLVSQLVLKVEKTSLQENINSDDKIHEKTDQDLPVDVSLEDDTLLNRIEMKEEREQVSCTPFEQAIILAICLLRRRFSETSDIQKEELGAYLEFLVDQPQTYVLHCHTLLVRSKLDHKFSRRFERSIKQLEELVHGFEKPSSSSRLPYFYCSQLLPNWMIEKERADFLLEAGLVKSALEIYLRLKFWDEAICCYKVLKITSQAIVLIEQQMEEEGKTPTLLCHLGDATDKPAFYEEAYELSNERSARAQRSLGDYHFKRKDFEKCLAYYQRSLELNYHQTGVWFSLGHAASQVEDYPLTCKAFRYYVDLNPDSFQGWNNLARAYIKMGQKMRAWRALQEALKCNYEEWKVWDNYLTVCLDVRAYEEAIKTWHKLIDLKKTFMEEGLLIMLAEGIIKNIPDIHNAPSGKQKGNLMSLLGRISATESNYLVWHIYAKLHSEADDKESQFQAMIYLRKCFNTLNTKPWFKELELTCHTLQVLEEHVASALKYGKQFEVNNELRSHISTIEGQVNTACNTLDRNLWNYFTNDQQEELTKSMTDLKSSLGELLTLVQ